VTQKILVLAVYVSTDGHWKTKLQQHWLFEKYLPRLRAKMSDGIFGQLDLDTESLLAISCRYGMTAK